jgi:hypothetical protein
MRHEGQGVSTRFYLESKPRINDLQFGFRKGISLNPLFRLGILRPGGGGDLAPLQPRPVPQLPGRLRYEAARG